MIKLLRIKKKFSRISVCLLMVMILSGCLPIDDAQLPAASTPAVTQTSPNPPAVNPTPTETKLITSDGPFLLIQTDFASYQILNIGAQTAMPFETPGRNQHSQLAQNLSPSRSQMLFPVSEDQVVIMSLQTGEVHTTYNLHSDDSIFQPDLAAQEALKVLSGIKYSEEALLSAVKKALTTSKLNIQWFGSDRYRLSVLEGTETSTNLTLDDHQTGQRTPLERLPGLVEDYWVRSGGDKILLKKGFVLEPGVWQDDRYFLVDTHRKEAKPIPLPKDVDNPSVFWFSPDLIGIIHQPAPVGGDNFSMVDIATMESRTVLTGSFSGLTAFGTHLLTWHHDQEARMTTLALRMLDGKVETTKTLDGICTVRATVDDRRLLMNCETESYLIDEETLLVSSFGEPVFLFSHSPSGSIIVMVTRSGKTTLLNAALQAQQTLTLEGSPLEIRWLPDSSGFLYRTQGKLYVFRLATGKSHLLMSSDIFNDYANFNAVWIKLK